MLDSVKVTVQTNYVWLPVQQSKLDASKKNILSTGKETWNQWCFSFLPTKWTVLRAIKILVLTLHPHHPMSWFQDQECASHSRGTVLHLHHRTKLELFQQESLSDLHEKPTAGETYVSNWELLLCRTFYQSLHDTDPMFKSNTDQCNEITWTKHTKNLHAQI